MASNMDEEILQDFLIEAGEILELLQHQLVSLENNPDDTELLNAIFRGFHTIKGGAGFLALEPMVDICHQAENIFDQLRNHKLSVSPELMDVILQSLDSINIMFAQTKAREDQQSASPELISQLENIVKNNTNSSEINNDDAIKPAENSHQNCDSTKTDQHASTSDSSCKNNSEQDSSVGANDSCDEITDEEFEKLLDELHGKGNTPSISVDSAKDKKNTESQTSVKKSTAKNKKVKGKSSSKTDITKKSSSGNNKAEKPAPIKTANTKEPQNDTGLISDDEFENLLDKFHGKGLGPSKKTPSASDKPKKHTNVSAKNNKQELTSAPILQADTTVRVDTARLDQIMNMVGELVLVRNRLISLGTYRQDEELSKSLINLDLVTGDLQGAVMKTRMQPIKKVFGRFPRLVRDLSRSLNKEIKLVLIGEETDLDKNLVEALADPLIHLVRNSIDHGIELPAERVANGKPKTGTITLSASQEGELILLKIEDDGKGINPETITNLAIERGIISHDVAQRMSEQEAYDLIFAPGFSTKVEVSDISGRGVGMDVVKTSIAKLNGTVNINAYPGKGTTLEIRVPLTLAIMPSLMVEVSQQTFALPLSSVSEIFHLDLNKTNVIDGQRTVTIRKKAIPLFYLSNWLCPHSSIKEKSNEYSHVVLIHLANITVAFVVDALVGQEEVVIKPLGKLLQGTPGMSGATITSDGGIALILDVPSLLTRYAHNS